MVNYLYLRFSCTQNIHNLIWLDSTENWWEFTGKVPLPIAKGVLTTDLTGLTNTGMLMLPSLGPQRVGHDWTTELNWVLKLAIILSTER